MSRPRAPLGDRDQQAVLVLGVVAAERVAGVDAVRRAAVEHGVDRRVERARRTRGRPAASCSSSTPSTAASALAGVGGALQQQLAELDEARACRARTGRSTPASAFSAWAVQMLRVAFSRRMCCSRVCSVSTKPRRPSTSVGLAGDPAGHAADVAPRWRAKKPNDGPPKSSRLPSVWPSPTATSTPQLAGRPQDRRAGAGRTAHDDQRAVRPWRRRRARSRSSTAPRKFGLLEEDGGGVVVDRRGQRGRRR